MRNGVLAIEKIRERGAHPNIVNIIRFGDFQEYYFIDMELCDLSLKTYIHRRDPSKESVPIFITDHPPPLKVQQIWKIMRHIANGLKFIHSIDLHHRDLKPDNGNTSWIE